MENPILYVVLNQDLQMSAGKATAQAVHAAMLLQDNFGGNFTSAYRRTVIVLQGTGDQIRNLHEYLNGADIFSQYYIDEGSNEVAPYSVTALAVEPFEMDDEAKREIFKPFKLFSVPETHNPWVGVAQFSILMAAFVTAIWLTTL